VHIQFRGRFLRKEKNIKNDREKRKIGIAIFHMSTGFFTQGLDLSHSHTYTQ